jgi:hypothetical protein
MDEAATGDPGSRSQACTLEGFGVMVDNVGHRFVAVTTVAA